MQNLVRYNVINEDGRPVIRAVPVPRRLSDPLVESGTQRSRPATQPAERATAATAQQDAPVRRRIRRLRILDIR